MAPNRWPNIAERLFPSKSKHMLYFRNKNKSLYNNCYQKDNYETHWSESNLLSVPSVPTPLYLNRSTRMGNTNQIQRKIGLKSGNQIKLSMALSEGSVSEQIDWKGFWNTIIINWLQDFKIEKTLYPFSDTIDSQNINCINKSKINFKYNVIYHKMTIDFKWTAFQLQNRGIPFKQFIELQLKLIQKPLIHCKQQKHLIKIQNNK